jgi:hypothetical protein
MPSGARGEVTCNNWIVNKSDLDRLGDRLRGGISPEDLTFLDTYRRGFRNAYDSVVDRVRAGLALRRVVAQRSQRPRLLTSSAVAVCDLCRCRTSPVVEWSFLTFQHKTG